jgi:hypothetical protein
MKRRVIIWSVMTALLTTLLAGATASASFAPAIKAATTPKTPCDGLAAYRTAMLKAGKRWIKGMQRDGLADRSTQSFSETEWEDYATRATRLLSDLRAIDPPHFAVSWHEAMVDAAQLKINFAQSASLLGFDFTAEFLGHRAGATTAEIAAAREAASASCADFATFNQEWELLDGKASAATASDSASVAGDRTDA